MMEKFKQIFLLYLREPGFMILSLLGFLSLSALQTLIFWGIEKNAWRDVQLNLGLSHKRILEILLNKYLLGEDLLSLSFILGLWLMFTLGILIKKQFANERASLLPGYRALHLTAALLIFILIVSVTFIMSKSALILSQFFFLHSLHISISLASIYLVVLIMALMMLYLGYFSMAYIVVFGYLALAFMGQNIVTITQMLSLHPVTFYTSLTFVIIAAFIFFHRLLILKSEHIEYPFLLTWPPQKTIRNQQALENRISLFKAHCLKIVGWTPVERSLTAYYQKQGRWARAHHWGYAWESRTSSLLLFALLASPLYIIFLKSFAAEFLLTPKIESNFLLFAGAPVLLAIITHYKSMIFWDYELLKPVTRQDFFQQQGIKFYRDLIAYWLIIAVYFAFIPEGLRGAEQFNQSHFWAFLFLTFTFSLLSLGWLGTLSALRNERAVILSGFVLCVLFMVEFLNAGLMTTAEIVMNALLCLLLAGLFLKLAFKKWMNKEF